MLPARLLEEEGNATASQSMGPEDILVSTLASVATAMSMAAFGVFAASRGLMPPAVAKGLSSLFMNISLPCLLFASILGCNQDWSTKPCPDVGHSVLMGWPLLVLPFVNVAVGALLGKLVVLVTSPPQDQHALCVSAVAFGNATGLPIALLVLIRESFPKTSELGEHNPLLFLSVYLLCYPAVQVAIGGRILGLVDHNKRARAATLMDDGEPEGVPSDGEREKSTQPDGAGVQLVENPQHGPAAPPAPVVATDAAEKAVRDAGDDDEEAAPPSCLQKVLKSDILQAVAKPPVMAAILAVIISATPVRGWFVDVEDRDNDLGDSPLLWAFHAIENMGSSAVPIQMLILGESLFKGAATSGTPVNCSTNVGVMLAKLVLCPAFGIGTVYFLSSVVDASGAAHSFDASLYLVVMLVTACPTANTVLVIATLGGQDTSVLSKLLFSQYAAAPILLTVSVTIMVGITQSFDKPDL